AGVDHVEVDQVTFLGDSLTIHDVELTLAEGRGNFVLHNFDLGTRPHHHVTFFDGGDAADIDADRRIELQRAPTGGSFGIAEHHADLLSDLVDEDQAGARLGNDSGQLAQGLRHQARLQTHVTVPHFALQLGLGHEGGDGDHHQH